MENLNSLVSYKQKVNRCKEYCDAVAYTYSYHSVQIDGLITVIMNLIGVRHEEKREWVVANLDAAS